MKIAHQFTGVDLKDIKVKSVKRTTEKLGVSRPRFQPSVSRTKSYGFNADSATIAVILTA